MKKINIVAIIMIIAGIVLLISAAGEVSNYYTFTEASISGQTVKVNATLTKDKALFI